MKPVCTKPTSACDCHGGSCWDCRSLERAVTPAGARVAGSAGVTAAPLGSNTDFASIFSDVVSLPTTQVEEFARPLSTPEGNVYEWECINWLSLAFARRVCERSGRWHRLMACGVRLNHGSRFVAVHSTPGASRAKVTGICRCGQTLCCPVCAPRVSGFRAEEVAHAYKMASGMGHDVYLVTLTAPHMAGSPLVEEALWWRDAWEWAFRNGRSAKDLKRNWVGYINAAEMTYSDRAGWHFHRHLLLFVESGYGELAVVMMRARWLAAINRGHRDNGGIDKYAFDAKRCDSAAAAWYCSKIGAELNKSTTKNSLSPLAILRRDAMAGVKDSPLWYEALSVCSDLKIGSCRWSRGLRAELELPPERSDADLAEDCIEVKDKFLGYVSASQWREIIYRRLEYNFLQVANLGEKEANQFLDAHGLGTLTTSEEYSDIKNASKN